MSGEPCVLGLDFGTDTVRAIVVEAADGAVRGVSVKPYPRWARGLYSEPLENRFRHHPLDYLETVESSVKEALAKAGAAVAGRVVALAVDTTGSTVALADATGTPLALTPGFEENPDAMFVLWKDHTALEEAARINHLARTWGGTDYTRFEGGIYSTEWFWSKALHILDRDPAIAGAAKTILELCDWLPAVLTGADDLAKIKRSRCGAGHKAMWHAEFGGYPPEAFFARLCPRLAALRSTLGNETFTSDVPFGGLSPEWAGRLGLKAGLPVAVGAFDAHMGAVGGGIGPGRLTLILGTSSLHMLVAPKPEGPEPVVPGICGQVDGSIVPGLIGYEAGQSAFGDVYAWVKRLLCWPLEAVLPSLPGAEPGAVRALATAAAERILPALEEAARDLAPDETSLLAVDWLNGRRTPDADQRLKGAITGITLGTDAPRVYRALVEATAFGTRAIVERFRSCGIRIRDAVAIGGVAVKSPLVVQVLADVMNMEIAVSYGEGVALGAAMFAATVGGVYPRVEDAQRAMALRVDRTYRPDPARAKIYDRLYRDYLALGGYVSQMLGR